MSKPWRFGLLVAFMLPPTVFSYFWLKANAPAVHEVLSAIFGLWMDYFAFRWIYAKF